MYKQLNSVAYDFIYRKTVLGDNPSKHDIANYFAILNLHKDNDLLPLIRHELCQQYDKCLVARGYAIYLGRIACNLYSSTDTIKDTKRPRGKLLMNLRIQEMLFCLFL